MQRSEFVITHKLISSELLELYRIILQGHDTSFYSVLFLLGMAMQIRIGCLSEICAAYIALYATYVGLCGYLHWRIHPHGHPQFLYLIIQWWIVFLQKPFERQNYPDDVKYSHDCLKYKLSNLVWQLTTALDAILSFVRSSSVYSGLLIDPSEIFFKFGVMLAIYINLLQG